MLAGKRQINLKKIFKGLNPHIYKDEGVGKKSNFHDQIYFLSNPIHLIFILLKIQSI